MSLTLFRCRCQFQAIRPHRYQCASRSHVSTKTITAHRTSKTPSNRLKWYGVVAVSTCMLGFGLWHARNTRQSASRPLSPGYFTTTTLSSSEGTSENAKLLRLTVPPEVVKNTPKFDFRPIWSVYIKDSDIQVERPYTPLEGLSQEGELTFWIKKYEHGEVGRWLHNRAPGEKIEIRGPEQTWNWRDDAWDSVVMVAGGTGITPFYQLLHALFTDPARSTNTKFTLLQSYRSPKEFPPPMILKNLSSWENSDLEKLKIRTFVDSLDGERPKATLSIRKISKGDLKSVLKSSGGRTIVLVCGPDSMINALAGPKERDQSQGPLGGVLGSLNDGSFQVWKL